VSATLRLTRDGVGIELRRGTFEVEVDRTLVGTIDWRETREFTLGPGQHTLVLRRGRDASRPNDFEVGDGGVAAFRCHGAMVWPRWLASALRPDLAIAVVSE
jgi:hypothetical protein